MERRWQSRVQLTAVKPIRTRRSSRSKAAATISTTNRCSPPTRTRPARSGTTFTWRGTRRLADQLAAEFALGLQPITARASLSRAQTIRLGREDRSARRRRWVPTGNFMWRGMITSRTRSCSIVRLTPEKLGERKRASQPKAFRSTSLCRRNRSVARWFIRCSTRIVPMGRIVGVCIAHGWTKLPRARPTSIFRIRTTEARIGRSAKRLPISCRSWSIDFFSGRRSIRSRVM